LDLSRILRLPDDLVSKIAAGEIVERPASVVKELVENALDAGARTVTVEVEAGGKTLIRVRDDGQGMEREDAALAVERHATSKLRRLEDLNDVRTHGFRGEALPSIASVSHLVLRTREDAASTGTEVEVRHGGPPRVGDAGHPRGTTVEVRDLFGAVPARRKFLRAETTETSHVVEAVMLLALSRPGTGFVLSSGSRTILQTPPVDRLRDRLFQVLGATALDELVPVEGGVDWARVSGFVSRADGRGSGRPEVRLFVNGRAVRDRALAKALGEGYRAAGVAEGRVRAFLFVEAPHHLVDVNVHPAKTEVRFADPRTAWVAVERAVAAALSAGARASAPRADTSRMQATGKPAPQESLRYTPGAGPTSAVHEGSAAAPAFAAPPVSVPAPAPTVIGQHRNTYILVNGGEDLVLVDQHTAHERVKYDALLQRMAARAVESQVLLLPLVVTLSPELRPVVEANAGLLLDLGFDIEPFGGDALRVRAVPALLGTRDPGPALEAMLRDVLEREASDWIVTGTRERLAASLACHSAVRAGQPLSRESMAAIVQDLARSEHPNLCPHGRPTTVRIPQDDVSRWFGRTGWKRR
jgi:DNA mismatch repair protein MutL